MPAQIFNPHRSLGNEEVVSYFFLTWEKFFLGCFVHNNFKSKAIITTFDFTASPMVFKINTRLSDLLQEQISGFLVHVIRVVKEPSEILTAFKR